MRQEMLSQFPGQFLKKLAAWTSYIYLFIGHSHHNVRKITTLWGESQAELQPTTSTNPPTNQPHQVAIWKWTLSPYIGLPVILHGAKMSYLFEAMNNFRFRRKINNCCCFKLIDLGWFVCSHRSLEYEGFIIRHIVRIPMVEGWMAALFD